jgi:hypothetical protein
MNPPKRFSHWRANGSKNSSPMTQKDFFDSIDPFRTSVSVRERVAPNNVYAPASVSSSVKKGTGHPVIG